MIRKREFMENLDIAQTIMTDFGARTCIRGVGCHPVRYLWTDAFAVCNFLELFRQTGRQGYVDEALVLIDQVHRVLGQYRGDDLRKGWISGLEEKEGELHPAIGGLRIGKKHNERKVDEPYNERLEWERDGQYFHYLTKWMCALNHATRATDNPKYNRWALELAQTAHSKFTHMAPANTMRIYWKMSTDLSYPLVSSMGQHDALDGYIAYLQLTQAAAKYEKASHELYPNTEIIQMSHMCQAIDWATDDPLGIGGLLGDACLLSQLIVQGNMKSLCDMLSKLLQYAKRGIDAFMFTDTLEYPAHYRLAFREFGLSIGLHGIKKMQALINEHPAHFKDHPLLQSQLKDLEAYLPLCKIIENFWLESENQKSNTWSEHLDINSVMLATSLIPDGYLKID